MLNYARPAARGRRRGALGCLLSGTPFFIVGLLMSYFLVYPAWHARLSGIETQGTIVSTEVCTSSDSGGGDAVARPFLAQDSGNSVSAVIRFTDSHGLQHEVNESSCGDYSTGQKVMLWYLPNDPQTFTTDQQLGTTFWVALIALGFAAPSLIGLLILLGRGLLFLVILPLAGTSQANQPQPAFVSPVFQPQPTYNAAFNPPPASNSPYSPTIPALVPPQLAPPTSKLPYRLGQTAEIGGQWTATLTRVSTSPGDARSRPAPGSVYLIVGVALRNRSSQPLDAFSAGRFLLWDAQGNEYQHALLAGTVFYLTGTLQPGEQSDEQLAFSVPAALRQFSLTFQRDRTSPPLATWEVNV